MQAIQGALHQGRILGKGEHQAPTKRAVAAYNAFGLILDAGAADVSAHFHKGTCIKKAFQTRDTDGIFIFHDNLRIPGNQIFLQKHLLPQCNIILPQNIYLRSIFQKLKIPGSEGLRRFTEPSDFLNFPGVTLIYQGLLKEYPQKKNI